MTEPQPKRRWIIPIAILAIAAIALIIIWNTGISRQHRIIRTTITGLITSVLIFLWLVLLSGIRARTRGLMFLLGLVLIGAVISSVEIHGVTGDLIPIVRWKWQKSANLATKPILAKASKTTAPAFPQFLGPDRNGIIRGVTLDTNWTARPPQELWRHAVGTAWTGFVVSDGIAITQEQRGPDELVTAYDLATGQLLWSHADAAHYLTTIGGEGPRANPTISSNRVYTLGATGIFNCLDLATGKLIWQHELSKDVDAHTPSWGFAGAPLVRNGQVILHAGGKNSRLIAAFDAASGKLAWTGGEDSASYASPTILNLAGADQLIIFSENQLGAYDPTNGKALWDHKWPASHPHNAMPIQISTNQILASSGYGYGSELLEITSTNGNFRAERVWKSNRLRAKFANLIHYKGHIYGLDDGAVTCLDAATGDRKWQGTRFGHGQMLLVGDIILLMSENGEIVLLQPAPDVEHILARHKALNGKTWNPPALAGEYLLVRNDLEAACFKLPLIAPHN